MKIGLTFLSLTVFSFTAFGGTFAPVGAPIQQRPQMGENIPSVGTGTNPNTGRDACRDIEAACSAKGFYVGGADNGEGLWEDCFQPIVRPDRQPANAKLELPSVSPEIAAECRAFRHER